MTTKQKLLRWAPLIAATFVFLVGAISANTWFFPLKPAMPWDEIIRYVFPGINPSNPFVPGTNPGIPTALVNGRTISFALGQLSSLFPGPFESVFYIYKNIVLLAGFAAAAGLGYCFYSGSRITGAAISALAFSLAPMTWIQANDIMVEPLDFPLAAAWLAAMSVLVRQNGNPARKTALTAATMTMLCYLMVMTSVQFFIAHVLAGLAALVVSNALIQKHRIKTTIRMLPIILIPPAIAFALWFFSHGGHNLAAHLGILGMQLSASTLNIDALATGMNIFDRYLFGLRSFSWMFFPALVLLIPVYFGIRKTLASRPAPQQLFLAAAAVIQPVLYAYAYRGNMQERYRYFPNMFLLCIFACLALAGAKEMVGRYGRKRIIPACLLVLMIATAAHDYASAARELPCLANLQVFSFYEKDRATCDRIKTALGLVRKNAVVTFPHISYANKFPTARPGRERPRIREVLDKIRAKLPQNAIPSAPGDNPNFLSSTSLWLMYIEKFGAPPPAGGNVPRMLVALAFPAGSPFLSTPYTLLERHSEEASAAEWTRLTLDRQISELVTEKNADYVLRMALIAPR